MTEDEAFNELEQRLKRQQAEMEMTPVYRANVAVAEYIQNQSIDILAITNIRQAFMHGYRTGFRDAKEEK
jgi:uroporphyrinogen-III synthase